MALPNFAINPYVQPYVGGVQKETGELISQRVQDYDIAAENYDVLGYQTDTLLQNVAPFEADRLYGQELMGKYRNVINEAAERGDYEFMVRDVKKAARQFGAETSPLVARRKAFDGYKQTVQEQYQKGDIDLEMYNAALNRTIADNSNVDKQTVMSGAFSGFVPTKKMDLTKYLDDFIKGMEAQGRIGKITENGDGTYSISGSEFRTWKDIEVAAQQALLGSSDYSNYATTLMSLGLMDKLQREENGALNAVKAKYTFSKDKTQQGFVPDWLAKKREQEALLRNMPSGPGAYSENYHNFNPLTGKKIIEDGTISIEDDYSFRKDGKYYTFTDENGRSISKNLVQQKVFEAYPAIRGANFGDNNLLQRAESLGYKTTQLDPQTEELERNKANKYFDEVVLKTLAYDKANGNIDEATSRLNMMTPTQLKAYRQQVKERLDKAHNVNKNILVPKWDKINFSDTKVIGDAQVSNAGVLAGKLGGRSLTPVTKLDGLNNKELRQVDVNTIYEKLNDEGWKVTELIDNGPLKINPTSENPGVLLTFKLEKEGQQRDFQIVAELGNSDQTPAFQALQNIMGKAISGVNETVQIGDNEFEIVNIPLENPTEGKGAFRTLIYDKSNNTMPIPVDMFPDYLMSISPTLSNEIKQLAVNQR
jgi:hypothetical protein